MDNQQITLEIEVEDAPREKASILLGDVERQLLDNVQDALVTRKTKPGNLDAGVLLVVLTHASVVLAFKALETWWEADPRRRLDKISVKVTDNDLEVYLGEEGAERLAKRLLDVSRKSKN